MSETLKELTWKEKWLQNYKGEGDCAELEKYVKTLNFGAKSNANYLPWAVVERIFKLQDGKTEPIKTNESIVEVDRVHIKSELDDNGVVRNEVFMNSYFVNVKATWQGQEYVEHYPLQDANGKPLQGYWTQNDLNKALQRGKVKAIAIVSGIGYKLFEDGDLLFGNDDQPAQAPSESNAKALSEKATPKKETKKDEPKKETPKKEESVKETPKEEAPKEEPKVENPAKETLPKEDVVIDRVELEGKIKKTFLSGGQDKAKTIREFMQTENVKKIQELSDEKLKALSDLIS